MQRSLERRLKDNNVDFFDAVRKLKLKSMADISKKIQITTKQKNVVELKQQGNIIFQLLMKAQNRGMSIDLENIMRFQLTPVLYSLGIADCHLAKANKAKAFQYLTKDVEDVRPPLNLIMDGNALFHSMTEIPDTFRDISEKVFRMIPTQSDVIFSTDTYAKGSIKDMERERRGTGDIFLEETC